MIILKNILTKQKNESVVSHHQINCNRKFNWNNAIVVDSENYYKKRLISKIIDIKCYQNSINKKRGYLHTES